jgi:flagellar hook-length control protein FliK
MKVDIVLPPSLIPCDFVTEALDTESSTENMPFSVALQEETLKALTQDVPQASANTAIPFGIVQFLAPDSETPQQHLQFNEDENLAKTSHVLPSLLGMIWTDAQWQNLPGKQSLPSKTSPMPEPVERGTTVPTLVAAPPVGAVTPEVIPTEAQQSAEVDAAPAPVDTAPVDTAPANTVRVHAATQSTGPVDTAPIDKTAPASSAPRRAALHPDVESELLVLADPIQPEREHQGVSAIADIRPAKSQDKTTEEPKTFDEAKAKSENVDRKSPEVTQVPLEDVARHNTHTTLPSAKPARRNDEPQMQLPETERTPHPADQAPQVSLPAAVFVHAEESAPEETEKHTGRFQQQEWSNVEAVSSEPIATGESAPIAATANEAPKGETPKVEGRKTDLKDLDFQIATRPRSAREGEVHVAQHSSEVRPETKETTFRETVTVGIAAQDNKHSLSDPTRTPEVRDANQTSQWSQIERTNVLSQLVEKARSLRWDKNSEIVVSLKPESLGRISMRASLVDRTMVATLAAESDHVRQILQMELPTIQRSLQDNGIVARVAVSEETTLNFNGSNLNQGQPRFGQNTEFPLREDVNPHNPAATIEVADARYTTHSVHLIA